MKKKLHKKSPPKAPPKVPASSIVTLQLKEREEGITDTMLYEIIGACKLMFESQGISDQACNSIACLLDEKYGGGWSVIAGPSLADTVSCFQVYDDMNLSLTIPDKNREVWVWKSEQS